MLYRQHADNVVGANVGLKAKLIRWGKLREGWLIKQALLIAYILGYANAWPISKLKRYSFLDRLVLIANVKKLRRRLRDRIALALFLLLRLKK
jgi:rhamnosyltransferase